MFKNELKKAMSRVPITFDEYMDSYDYIPVEKLRETLDISPTMMVDYLRIYRDTLPFYGELDNEFSPNIEEKKWFYTCQRENATTMLHDIFIHKNDITNHAKIIRAKGDPLSLAEYSKISNFMSEDFPELRQPLEDKDARIAALESELAAANQRIAELTADMDATKATSALPVCDGKGLPAVVCRMRREGKCEKEIAEYLSGGKKKWCSASQVGALLHPDETSKIASESMRQAALRLLGKA